LLFFKPFYSLANVSSLLIKKKKKKKKKKEKKEREKEERKERRDLKQRRDF